MFRIAIGNNIYMPDPRNRRMLPSNLSNLDDSIKSYDHMLHESLDKIFRERCLSSSDQIKKFLRSPRHNTNQESIIKPVLKQEPALSKHFSKDELGKLSLLWIALLGCYEKSTELLLRSGADVNELFGRHDPQLIDEKWTVLHVLLKMRPSPMNERLIRLVTDRGADLQARDSRGQTTLHFTVAQNLVEMTEWLLEKGADVNAADNYGMSPLLDAVYRNKANELVPLLMKYGANAFAKSRSGQNALHYLTDADSDVKNAAVARVLIEKGVSFDDEEQGTGFQPMHAAASVGRNDLIKLYLDHGANVNARTKSRNTSLHLAVTCFDGRKVVKTLLERGANIHLRAREGQTALHVVCNFASLDGLNTFRHDISKGIIRQLLSAGADVLAKDHSGKTPFALISSSLQTMEQPGTWLMIEALALKKALQPSIVLKDEMIIARNKKLQDYYQKCTDEIYRMKSTRFIDSCTFFDFLAKRRCQIAAFMRNPDFKIKFRLYDLNDEFSIYVEDVRQAFERVQNHYQRMLEKENLINEAVYNMLPYLVVKKVVHYTFNCCNKNVKCFANY